MTGPEIIADVLARRQIGRVDFFCRSQLPHLVKARRAAILALGRAGLKTKAIAALVQRDKSTVRYYRRTPRVAHATA